METEDDDDDIFEEAHEACFSGVPHVKEDLDEQYFVSLCSICLFDLLVSFEDMSKRLSMVEGALFSEARNN